MLTETDVHLWLATQVHPEPWHNERYAKTLAYLDKLPHSAVLDIGQETVFTQAMRHFWPASSIKASGQYDIRTVAFGDQCYDLIVMTEVIEHVADLPSGVNDTWTGSGQASAVKLRHSELTRKGYLFVTTPNGCHYRVLEEAKNNRRPACYAPHIREMPQAEFLHLFSTPDWEIVESGSWVVWGHHNMSEARLLAWMAICGELSFRGDDLFLLARRLR